MKFTDAFSSSETRTTTHFWTLCNQNSDETIIDTIALSLAKLIMRFRCHPNDHYYKAWGKRLQGGNPHPDRTKIILEQAYIKPTFGLPENPVHCDHLEGYVGEMLWYFLYQEIANEQIANIEPPGFKATDSGGDALVIHRLQNRTLMFRLWELKKCSGDNADVSKTVSKAYKQLKARSMEYLARLTPIGEERYLDDPEMRNFYGQLVELWVDADPAAAAGVAVATSCALAPNRCFSTFGKHFPEFTNPIRLQGMLTAIEDFPAFSQKVREYVWKGL